MNRLALLAAVIALPACFITPAQPAGGGTAPPPGGGDPYAGSGDANPATAGGSEPAAPAGPQVVSVTLRNTCPSTVKLFMGDKPKFGSGTYTSLSSNTVTSYSMKEGDLIWIVDDSENGLSSTSISRASTNIEILPSCTGFVMR
ncbi:MAG TPA: hypothetical protein VL172_16315 [Kofleriaceae bacterium]|nr:hypothetical protein [Kofleriaceae bacterium]